MLVLVRYPGERILLSWEGVEIWLSVVEVGGHRVRLGIEAPRSVIITREELLPPREDDEEGHKE